MTPTTQAVAGRKEQRQELKRLLRRGLRNDSGGWPAEWAHFAIALVFQGVDPVTVLHWDADEVLDAMAVIEELNADAKRRERRSR